MLSLKETATELVWVVVGEAPVMVEKGLCCRRKWARAGVSDPEGNGNSGAGNWGKSVR